MGRSGSVRRVAVAVAALLVLYGVVGLVPHTHGDATVPRLDTLCAASASPVPLLHLHRGAPRLPAHACLACLIGPASAAVGERSGWTVAQAPLAIATMVARRGAFQRLRGLPDLRAPPRLLS